MKLLLLTVLLFSSLISYSQQGVIYFTNKKVPFEDFNPSSNCLNVLSFKIESDVDAAANQAGNGKSFELIDSTPGDLLALGHAEGLSVSSQEPQIQLAIIRQDTNVNESHIVEAEVALTIGYTGTTGTPHDLFRLWPAGCCNRSTAQFLDRSTRGDECLVDLDFCCSFPNASG